MAKDASQRHDTRRLPSARGEKTAKHVGGFLGHLFGRSIAAISPRTR